MAKVTPPKGVTNPPMSLEEAAEINAAPAPTVADVTAPVAAVSTAIASVGQAAAGATAAIQTMSEGLTALSQFADEDESMEGMREFLIVPRLKIIQGQTDPELKKRFGEGSVVINPGDTLVAKSEAPFLFVPLFHFSEYCFWSDRRDKEARAIIERSFDPNSKLAQNAADKNKREVMYDGHGTRPEKERWFKRYVHHFCFPGIIYTEGHELSMTPCVLSFERGEWTTGRQFISNVQMKKFDLPNGTRKTLPLWAQVWQLQTKIRNGDSGTWWGYEPRFAHRIKDQEINPFQVQHLEFSRLHAEKLIQVDHGTEGQAGEVAENEAAVAARVEAKGEM